MFQLFFFTACHMAKQDSKTTTFFLIALVVLAGGVIYSLLMPSPPVGGDGSLPELQVAGWLNGPPPELEGKVVVLDVFASW